MELYPNKTEFWNFKTIVPARVAAAYRPWWVILWFAPVLVFVSVSLEDYFRGEGVKTWRKRCNDLVRADHDLSEKGDF